MVKNLPASAGDVSSIPGSGRSPEEGKATVFSILAWKIPWTKRSLVDHKESDTAGMVK